MAKANGMMKMFSKLNTVGSSDEDEPTISNVWAPFESPKNEIDEVERLIPPMSAMTPMQWGTIVRGFIREHRGVKARDVLRLILRAASANWQEAIMRKCTVLILRIEKYGGEKEHLSEFWEWLEQTYEVPKK